MALVLSSPPELKIDMEPKFLPPEIQDLTELQTTFQAFYRATGGDALWAKHRSAYAAEVLKFIPMVRDVILGPYTGRTLQRMAIRHEYLYFLLDPLILKYQKLILEKKHLSLAEKQPFIPEDYQDNFLLVFTESLLKAVESRLTEKVEEDRRRLNLYEKYQRGLVLIFYFEGVLAEFEDTHALLWRSFPILSTR